MRTIALREILDPLLKGVKEDSPSVRDGRFLAMLFAKETTPNVVIAGEVDLAKGMVTADTFMTLWYPGIISVDVVFNPETKQRSKQYSTNNFAGMSGVTMLTAYKQYTTIAPLGGNFLALYREYQREYYRLQFPPP